MAEASKFKFGIELGFAKPYYKITPKDKSGVALVWELRNIWCSPLIFMQWLKLAIPNSVHNLGSPIKPIIKSQK